jgi:putative transposase
LSSYSQLYVHCVWATWDRQPLITPEIEPRLYDAMEAKCRALGCRPLAIGGMPDHVHLLIGFMPTIPIARLVGEIKGSSSHLITHVVAPGKGFKWQGSYSAFSVSKRGVRAVERYIRNQKAHHTGGRLREDLEALPDEA